jgi:hypothetical protein
VCGGADAEEELVGEGEGDWWPAADELAYEAEVGEGGVGGDVGAEGRGEAEGECGPGEGACVFAGAAADEQGHGADDDEAVDADG